MVVMRLENGRDLTGEVRYICGGKGYKERDAYIELPDLEEGEYLFYVEMEWEASTAVRSFCATCYGASKVVFQEDVASSYSQEEVLRKVYTAKALGRHFAGLKVTDMADKGAPNIRRYQSS